MNAHAAPFSEQSIAVCWRRMECAPRDRPIILFNRETGEQAVCSFMTSPINGDTQWIMGRAQLENGDQVALIFRDPACWAPALPTPAWPRIAETRR